MNHISKLGTKLLIGALSLSSTFSGIADVNACGGRGGGGGGGGGGFYRPQQAYSQPAYYPQSQPYYQPIQSYPTAPVSYQQFPGGQQQPVGVAPQSAMPTVSGGAPATNNGMIQQTQFNQNMPVQAGQAVQTQLPNSGAQPTAVQNTVATTPVQSIQTQTTAPVSAPSTPNAAPVVASPSPNGNATSAETSALQALAGFGLGTTTAAPTGASQFLPSTANYVGNWSASLPNGTSVQLTLQADGSFRWIATSDGKSTSFEGTYTLEEGALTLARSSDNQKLSGAMISTNSNGFNFKLTGAKDSGLQFSRS